MATEESSPRFRGIEAWPTVEAVAAMAEDQLAAAAAVSAQAGAIAAAAEAAAERLRQGKGRIAYCGAGTSARLAVQDGVELVPTFGWEEERLAFLIAGGTPALTAGIEGAEDDEGGARSAVEKAGLGAEDVMVAVSASGTTPFTHAGLRAAGEAGALTIAFANNRGAPLLAGADHPILLDTGPEAVAGSTRMKAGTAQKIALNLLSTATMLRLGRIHRGLMVAMRPTNAKLRARATAMVAQLSGAGRDAAQAALAQADGDIRLATLIALGAEEEEARRALAAAGGDLEAARRVVEKG